jgi:hypothetical protein
MQGPKGDPSEHKLEGSSSESSNLQSSKFNKTNAWIQNCADDDCMRLNNTLSERHDCTTRSKRARCISSIATFPGRSHLSANPTPDIPITGIILSMTHLRKDERTRLAHTLSRYKPDWGSYYVWHPHNKQYSAHDTTAEVREKIILHTPKVLPAPNAGVDEAPKAGVDVAPNTCTPSGVNVHAFVHHQGLQHNVLWIPTVFICVQNMSMLIDSTFALSSAVDKCRCLFTVTEKH